jgi:hypothetical protein
MSRADAFRAAAKEIRRVAPAQPDDVRIVMFETADHLDKGAETIDGWTKLGELMAKFGFGLGQK